MSCVSLKLYVNTAHSQLELTIARSAQRQRPPKGAFASTLSALGQVPDVPQRIAWNDATAAIAAERATIAARQVAEAERSMAEQYTYKEARLAGSTSSGNY